MSNIPATSFSDDAPKTNPWEEDRLGFRPFASRLADTILSMEAPRGYVIGLHGTWGSGKSTVLNFVQAFVEKHNQERGDGRPLLVVDFRPWMISGHQDLVSAYLKVLSEALTPASEARRRRGWKRLLKIGKAAAGPITEAAATLAMTADPGVAPAIKAGSAFAGTSAAATLDRWLAEPSLQAAYDALKDKLADADVRVLVLVDDIDRLERAEIRSTLQMVKTVGRLPNIVYLLAYDREIVWSALDEAAEVAANRPGFAEKIVQHELELPQPSVNALLTLLDAEIAFVPLPEVKSYRHQAMIDHGVARWIQRPRDVARLSNALRFSWPPLDGEIDHMDLLCMEGLRLFDQQAFAWVRDNRALLIDGFGFGLLTKEQRAAAMKAVRDGWPEPVREDRVEVLCALFPNHAEDIRGRQRFGSEAWVEVVKRRGVASADGYDAYFSLHPPVGALAKRTVDAAVASLSDEAFQVATLRSLLDKGDASSKLVGDYLTELQYRFIGTSAAEPTAELLQALFFVGEEVQPLRGGRGFPSLEPGHRLGFLIKTMLERWSPEEAGRNLVQAFGRSSSPALCAEVYVWRARELGMLPAEGAAPAQLVSPATMETLGTTLLKMIEVGAADGTLGRAPAFYDILRAWSLLAGNSAPNEWLAANVASSASFLAKATQGLLAYTVDLDRRTYVLREQPDERLYDLDALLLACGRHRGTGSLTSDESDRIDALDDGLKRMPRSSTGSMAPS